jgi:hypothetical protein
MIVVKRAYGKQPARADARRIQLAVYQSAILPPAPVTCDRTYGLTDWGVMRNDTIGLCAYASAGHMQMGWSLGARKKAVIIPDADIVQAYAVGTGYDPATGAGDNGSNLLNVQEQWRTAGIAGNRIVASGALDLRNAGSIREAVYYYGGAYIGVMLPASAEQQTDAGLVWTTPWFSPIVGGHAVPILSYDAHHVWLITWGKVQCATWDFIFRYCDEAYAIVDPLWITADSVAVDSGLNISALVADIAAVNAIAPAPPGEGRRAA